MPSVPCFVHVNVFAFIFLFYINNFGLFSSVSMTSQIGAAGGGAEGLSARGKNVRTSVKEKMKIKRKMKMEEEDERIPDPPEDPEGGRNGEKAGGGGQCQVCGAEGAGRHYGSVCCSGCKGFFRRSVRFQKLYRCPYGQQCTISKIYRNCCRACRFRKCLQIGLDPNLVHGDWGQTAACPSVPIPSSSSSPSHLRPPNSSSSSASSRSSIPPTSSFQSSLPPASSSSPSYSPSTHPPASSSSSSAPSFPPSSSSSLSSLPLSSSSSNLLPSTSSFAFSLPSSSSFSLSLHHPASSISSSSSSLPSSSSSLHPASSAPSSSLSFPLPPLQSCPFATTALVHQNSLINSADSNDLALGYRNGKFELEGDDCVALSKYFVAVERLCDLFVDCPHPGTKPFNLDVPIEIALKQPGKVSSRTPIGWTGQYLISKENIARGYCRAMVRYFDWVSHVPELNALTEEDRQTLIVKRAMRCIWLLCTFRSAQLNIEGVAGCCEMMFPYRPDQRERLDPELKDLFLDSATMAFTELVLPFRHLRLSESEYALLRALCLFSPVSRLSEEGRVEVGRAQNKYLNALGELVRRNEAEGKMEGGALGRMSRLMMFMAIVEQVAQMDDNAFAMLNVFNLAGMRGGLTYDIHIRALEENGGSAP